MVVRSPRRQVAILFGLRLAIYSQLVNSAPLNRAVAQLGSAVAAATGRNPVWIATRDLFTIGQ